MQSIDLGVIKFKPVPNAADEPQLAAAVEAIETHVFVDVGPDGLWRVAIEDDVVAEEYLTPNAACMAAMGLLIVHVVGRVEHPEETDQDWQRRDRLYRDWLNTVVETIRPRREFMKR